jgi:hypothetical protein
MLGVFMTAVLIFFGGFLAFQVFALVTWRGGWRFVAVLPGLALGLVVARIVIDTHRDPTAHNLWPFEILIWSGLGVVVLGILQIARLAMRSKTSAL